MNKMSVVNSLGRSATRLACLLAALPVLAHAAIVEMDARDFRTATSSTVLAVEDFEGLAAGPVESPVPLVNGLIYSSAAPWVFAPAPGYTSLTGDTPLSAPRTFIVTEPGINAFVAGTRPSETVMVVTRGALETFDRVDFDDFVR